MVFYVGVCSHGVGGHTAIPVQLVRLLVCSFCFLLRGGNLHVALVGWQSGSVNRALLWLLTQK